MTDQDKKLHALREAVRAAQALQQAMRDLFAAHGSDMEKLQSATVHDIEQAIAGLTERDYASNHDSYNIATIINLDAKVAQSHFADATGIKTEDLGNGVTVYRVTDNSAPGYFAYVTDASRRRIPADPENETMRFSVFHEDKPEPLKVAELTGRAGLLAWYVENVGYDPDADNGSPLPVLDLIDRVAGHLMFREMPEF
jgi:type II secretory pathway pseudopilin PulG